MFHVKHKCIIGSYTIKTLKSAYTFYFIIIIFPGNILPAI